MQLNAVIILKSSNEYDKKIVQKVAAKWTFILLWEHVKGLAPLMACSDHWVLYPFTNGAVDGVIVVDFAGDITVSCKRTLKVLSTTLCVTSIRVWMHILSLGFCS